jgi:iron(III) transport system substrate-binding protein
MILALGAMAAALGVAASVLAADASLAQYEGADRMEKIVAAAKKEGALTLYTTIAEKDLPAIVKPFEQKYGIKVSVWRAGTDKVLQRTVTEAGARKYDVDAVHFGSPRWKRSRARRSSRP